MLSKWCVCLQVPCSLIYGESDWMKPDAGKRIMEDVEKERGKLSESDLQVRKARLCQDAHTT